MANIKNTPRNTPRNKPQPVSEPEPAIITAPEPRSPRPSRPSAPSKPAGPSRLSAFLADKRTRIVGGLALLCMAMFTLTSLASFLLTGKADQSVIEHVGMGTFIRYGAETQNWLGVWGAIISHLLIYKFCGIGSVLLMPLLFSVGRQLLRDQRPLRLSTLASDCLFSTFWISILMGYWVHLQKEPNLLTFLCGDLGLAIARVGHSLFGSGTILLLLLALVSYLIYRIQLSTLEAWAERLNRPKAPKPPKPAPVQPEVVAVAKPHTPAHPDWEPPKPYTDPEHRAQTLSALREQLEGLQPVQEAKTPEQGGEQQPAVGSMRFSAQTPVAEIMEAVGERLGEPATQQAEQPQESQTAPPAPKGKGEPLYILEQICEAEHSSLEAGKETTAPEATVQETAQENKAAEATAAAAAVEAAETVEVSATTAAVTEAAVTETPEKAEELVTETAAETTAEPAQVEAPAAIPEAIEAPSAQPSANVEEQDESEAASLGAVAMAAAAGSTLSALGGAAAVAAAGPLAPAAASALSTSLEAARAAAQAQGRTPAPQAGSAEDAMTFQVQDTSEVDKPLVDKLERPTPEQVTSMDAYDPKADLSRYQYPELQLLKMHEQGKTNHVSQEELEEHKERIIQTLQHFGIKIVSISATVGPTVTLYEIVPDSGTRVAKIRNLEDDIALSLSALGIRIIAPIPGKGTIGLEVPNKKREMVSMRSVLATEKFAKCDMELPIALGRTISNEVFITDLAKTPHLLIAGATGQGKSVGINVLLASLLYKKHPSELKLVMIDPKKVELSVYNRIDRHFLAAQPGAEEIIITDTTKAVEVLNSLVIEMENRYELLKIAGMRNIIEYNNKFKARRLNPLDGHRFLPYIVLIIDELADLMMTAGKEIEQPIARLAQKARAIGIHLVVATQRPSVDVITGLIKANFPSRLAFRVVSKIDSRTVLDQSGADQLIGVGDMLFFNGQQLTRVQCAYVSTEEVEEICDFISQQQGYSGAYELPDSLVNEEELASDRSSGGGDRDEHFNEAANIIVSTQQGSTSLLQRRMSLGYARAGRIMDQLEQAGIVGPGLGSKPRQVLVPDLLALYRLLGLDGGDDF